MRRRNTLVLVLAAAVLPGAAPPTPQLTLRAAIEAALRTDPRLAAAVSGVEMAVAGQRQAQARRLPRVDLSYTLQHTNNPVFVFGNLLRQGRFTADNFDLEGLNHPDPISNFTPALSVLQPIWTGGSIARRVEAAEFGVDAAGLSEARTRQVVIYDTVSAYAAAVVARRHLAVADESVRTAGAHVELATQLRTAGLVVDSDVLRAQVRASEAREAQVRARSGVAVAEAALNLTMGRDLSAPVSLPDDLDETVGIASELEPLLQTALATRPDLQAAAAQEAAVGRLLEAERAALMPQFGVQAFAESNSDSMFGHQSANWGVTLGARFTLFDGSARNAAAARRLAERRTARMEATRLRRAIVLETTRAFYDVQAAVETVAQAQAAVELARENLRLVENRYREGLATSVELLDAQTDLTTAQTRVVSGRRDLMMGRAALDLAIGREDLISKENPS